MTAMLTADDLAVLYLTRDERYAWWKRRLTDDEVLVIEDCRTQEIWLRVRAPERSRALDMLRAWRRPVLVKRTPPTLVV